MGEGEIGLVVGAVNNGGRMGLGFGIWLFGGVWAWKLGLGS